MKASYLLVGGAVLCVAVLTAATNRLDRKAEAERIEYPEPTWCETVKEAILATPPETHSTLGLSVILQLAGWECGVGELAASCWDLGPTNPGRLKRVILVDDGFIVYAPDCIETHTFGE